MRVHSLPGERCSPVGSVVIRLNYRVNGSLISTKRCRHGRHRRVSQLLPGHPDVPSHALSLSKQREDRSHGCICWAVTSWLNYGEAQVLLSHLFLLRISTLPQMKPFNSAVITLFFTSRDRQMYSIPPLHHSSQCAGANPRGGGGGLHLCAVHAGIKSSSAGLLRIRVFL